MFYFNPLFQYKVVTDNCEHAFWEECEDQTKKVPFHVSCTLKAYLLGVHVFTMKLFSEKRFLRHGLSNIKIFLTKK